MVIRSWRLLRFDAQDAFSAMAWDEALFEEYCRTGSSPVVRFYGWRPAAYSVGFSQDASVLDTEGCRKAGIDFVRRMTGGGIIYHDHELSYSIACSAGDIAGGAHVSRSFRTLTSFLLHAYRKMGLNARYAVDAESEDERLDRPSSVCFASNARYDIVVEGKKLGGNAQKRRRDMIFQHGSIPFSIDRKKIFAFLAQPGGVNLDMACGLNETSQRMWDFQSLRDILIESFETVFSVRLRPDGPTDAETAAASRLAAVKYTSDAWNLARQEKAGQLDGYRAFSTHAAPLAA